ncbi:MAG: hypothetical protein FWB75_00970 [Oscillospiraceae bacterium]|nr:hypothetical protein [Oscillospiraceae bacterium]
MNVSNLLSNVAEKPVFTGTTDELQNKQCSNSSEGTDSGPVKVVDSFGSAPDIDHYNNYSKTGVIAENIAPHQASLSQSPRTSKHLPGAVPDWTNIPSRGMSALSKDEIRQRVRELGVALANATSDDERGEILEEYWSLQLQFISHASPDRKAIHARAVETIERHAGGGQGFGLSSPRTLLDHLISRDNSSMGMRFDKAYPIAGGGSVTAKMVTGGGATFRVEHLGEPVLIIGVGQSQGNGVFYKLTSAESTLKREIVDLFDRAAGRSPIIWD